MSSEVEIRRRLGYRAWSCQLCPVSFFSQTDAENHFHPAFSRHPGRPLSVAHRPDVAKERELAHALGLARAQASSSSSRSKVEETNSENGSLAKEDAERSIEQKVDIEAKGGKDHASVVCAKCSVRVGSLLRLLQNHVVFRHSKEPLLACKACKKGFAKPKSLRLHVANEHKVGDWESLKLEQKMSPADSERLFRACFPSVDPQREAYKRCVKCPEARFRKHLDHVSHYHMGKAVMSCSLCDYSAKRWNCLTQMKAHIRTHRGGTARIVDHREELKGALSALVDSLIKGDHETPQQGSGAKASTENAENQSSAVITKPEVQEAGYFDLGAEEWTAEIQGPSTWVKQEPGEDLEASQLKFPLQVTSRPAERDEAARAEQRPKTELPEEEEDDEEEEEKSAGLEQTNDQEDEGTSESSFKTDKDAHRKSFLKDDDQSKSYFNEACKEPEAKPVDLEQIEKGSEMPKAPVLAIKAELRDESECAASSVKSELAEDEAKSEPTQLSSIQEFDLHDAEKLVGMDQDAALQPTENYVACQVDEGTKKTEADDEPSFGLSLSASWLRDSDSDEEQAPNNQPALNKGTEEEPEKMDTEENGGTLKTEDESKKLEGKKGSIECTFCKMRVSNEYNSRCNHVERHHMGDRKRFACKRCPVRLMSRTSFRHHTSVFHSGISWQEALDESPLDLTLRKRQQKLCFPEAPPKPASKRVHCLGCGQNVVGPRNHVAVAHLQLPLFSCPLQDCPKSSHSWVYGRKCIEMHLAKEHSAGEAAGLGPVDRRAEHRPALEAMLRRHVPSFGTGPRGCLRAPPDQLNHHTEVMEEEDPAVDDGELLRRKARCVQCGKLLSRGRRRHHALSFHAGASVVCGACPDLRFPSFHAARDHAGDRHPGMDVSVQRIELDDVNMKLLMDSCFPE